MKKFIFLLTIILVTSLSGCLQENVVTFNIENNYQINHIVGDSELDLEDITASNSDGDDLTSSITTSAYNLDLAGSFEVLLTATDKDGTKGTVTVFVTVSKINCVTNPLHDTCFVPVTELNFVDLVTSETTLYIGDSILLKWEVLPVDATTPEVTIESSNSDVASILSNGFVEAKTLGETEITIRTSEITISHTIIVAEKTCAVDPTQDKCFASILGDSSRLTTFTNANISGTDYNLMYPKNDLYYEIYVRKFADSDGNYKGDFNGITENISYLKGLGVGALWLMPIMESRSDHGYETDDYYSVDSEYGSMDDFKALIAAAHEEDIDIIIDFVVNHMGARNSIFQDVLRNGVASDYYDWFVWADENDSRIDDKKYDGGPIWYNPSDRYWLKESSSFDIHESLDDKYYYALFSDWMPDLNLENPEVVTYIYDVADFWLTDVGVDGFRLDATSHFFHNDEYNISNAHSKNVEFLTDFNAHLKTIDPDVYVVAEAWEGYQTYGTYYASEISMFDFQTKYYIEDRLKGYSTNLGSKLSSLYNYYDNYDADFIDAVFLSNHDMDRISTSVGDENTRLGAEILLTLPGNPFIYYGDEIGMEGVRTNMVWGNYYSGLSTEFADQGIDTVSEQLALSDSLLNTYIELGLLRKNSLALKFGDFTPYTATGLEGYYRYFENGDDKELVLVLFNYSDTIVRSIPSEFTSYEVLYASRESNIGGISPRSMVILRLPVE